MLRRIQLGIISFFCLGVNSCYAQRPAKLPHEMCTLSLTDSASLCVMSGTTAPSVEEKPLQYLHKATCRTPENEAVNQVNLHNMEAYADFLEKKIQVLEERKKK